MSIKSLTQRHGGTEQRTSSINSLCASVPLCEHSGFVAVALAVVVGLWTVTVARAGESNVVRLTTDGHLKQRPAWSPDGTWLAFTRHQGATIFLFLRSADGT